MRPLLIGLSPNVTDDDIAMSTVLSKDPEQWIDGPALERLKRALQNRFHPADVFLFDSGRWSLTAILKALRLQGEEEVLLQAFTCVAVPNAVLWAGGKPVYVDIGEDLTMDVVDLKRKMTSMARAIIIQHTFGAAANIDALREIAKKGNLLVIEDCAHALGGMYRGKPLGTFGSAAILSFGRDKVISSVNGGAAIVTDKALVAGVEEVWEESSALPRERVGRLLRHPLVTSHARAWYGRAAIGQLFLRLHQIKGSLEQSVFPAEKQGEKPREIGYRLPNALAELAMHQLNKLERMNRRRVAIAKQYKRALGLRSLVHSQEENSVFLRYPLLVHDPSGLHAAAKRHNILLGDWYNAPVAPRDTDLDAIGYRRGSCPNAERIAEKIVNLPTMPWMSDSDVWRVIRVVREFHADD